MISRSNAHRQQPRGLTGVRRRDHLCHRREARAERLEDFFFVVCEEDCQPYSYGPTPRPWRGCQTRDSPARRRARRGSRAVARLGGDAMAPPMLRRCSCDGRPRPVPARLVVKYGSNMRGTHLGNAGPLSRMVSRRGGRRAARDQAYRRRGSCGLWRRVFRQLRRMLRVGHRLTRPSATLAVDDQFGQRRRQLDVTGACPTPADAAAAASRHRR